MMAKRGCCEICGKKSDILNGGCAIMLTFCRRHSTNLMNVSYCADCYNALLKEKFKTFADSACLDIVDIDDVDGKEQDDG